jgi:hypothetical protein
MSVFININGVIHEASGDLSIALDTDPATLPAQNHADVTPVLNANSCNSYLASATSEYSESGTTASAFKAFNNVSGSGWQNGWSSTAQATAAAPQILELDLPALQVVYSYSVKIRSDANTMAPFAWALEGWDGSAWVAVQNVSGLTWVNGELKTFTVTTPGIFGRYRWRITDSGPLCQIDEIRIYS